MTNLKSTISEVQQNLQILVKNPFYKIITIIKVKDLSRLHKKKALTN